MKVFPELSKTEKSRLEKQAARLYLELQKLITELNEVSDQLKAGGIVPQLFSISLHSCIAVDPFQATDSAHNFRILASYSQRPNTAKGADFWLRCCSIYDRAPDVVHRTNRTGYIAVFKRKGLMPIYIGEDMKEVEGAEGTFNLPATSLEELHIGLDQLCPAWSAWGDTTKVEEGKLGKVWSHGRFYHYFRPQRDGGRGSRDQPETKDDAADA